MILNYTDYERERTFDADVVVVGTGAGGAAAGAELALAGLSVVFVEEGSHHPTSSFNPYVSETIPRLYRDASSTILFGTPDIAYLEGRCVGGSTVINGGMAYRAPEKILDGWVEKTGSTELGPRGLEPYFEQVEASVHVAHQIDVSIGDDNLMMAAGARARLEVRGESPQSGSVRRDEQLRLWLSDWRKQSTLVTYIPRALAAGARCLTEIRVEELIIERGRAVGVRGRAVNPRTRRKDRPVEIRARAVIVAGGAVQTPYLLLRHGIGRRSPQLGKNLLCHPNVKVLGVYPFDVNAWKGVSQYGQVREFDDEGILMAENMVPPGALAAMIPYVGRSSWELMRRYNQIMATGVLVEDSTTGTVSRGPFGLATPKYDITPYDHERFIRGARLLAQLHFEMGAEYVVLPFLNHATARTPDDLRALDTSSVPPHAIELLTVHLMGTARMGRSLADSVVGLNGELWNLPGCYVADASLFPSAIGRNPQITIMALATMVAHKLGDSLLGRKAA